ncbi:MAG: DUF2490 domain-containing protein [Erythrobacter sp.]
MAALRAGAAAAAIAAGVAAMPASASNQEFQQWTQITAIGPVKDKVLIYAEFQPRLTNDATRIGQLFVRPAIGYQIDKNTSVFIGYAYVRSEPEGRPASTEHRIWQQVAFKIADIGDLSIISRARLEQRNFLGSDETGWRYRQQFRGQFPLIDGAGIAGVVWSEPFYNLNSADWGARAGFDRWRNFAGIAVPVGKLASLEAGYMNQAVFREGPDRSDHVLSFKLFYRF